MKIGENETELIGAWVLDEKRVVEDDISKRINWLTENYLIKITTDESGWDTLYKDPESNLYWERIYPNSQMQGGGAPALISLSEDKAKIKYGNF